MKIKGRVVFGYHAQVVDGDSGLIMGDGCGAVGEADR